MSCDEMLPRCGASVSPNMVCGHPASKRDPRGPAYCARHWAKGDEMAGPPPWSQSGMYEYGETIPHAPPPSYAQRFDVIAFGTTKVAVDAFIAALERQMEAG